MEKKQIHIKLSKSSVAFLENRKATTGENISEIIDKIIEQHQYQSEEHMHQQKDIIISELEPVLSNLKVILNENNFKVKVLERMVDYLLQVENYSTDYASAIKGKSHLATLDIIREVRSDITNQKIKAIENKRYQNEKGE